MSRLPAGLVALLHPAASGLASQALRRRKELFRQKTHDDMKRSACRVGGRRECAQVTSIDAMPIEIQIEKSNASPNFTKKKVIVSWSGILPDLALASADAAALLMDGCRGLQ